MSLHRQRFAHFVLWALNQPGGGFFLTGPLVAEKFRVSQATARDWLADYFTVRGCSGQRLKSRHSRETAATKYAQQARHP